MWRFVQISDPHLGSYTDGRWNNGFICTMMPDVMKCLRRDLRDLRPDFILATGDLCSQPTRDAAFAARDFLDWLRVPYYPMGGNHDFAAESSRAWFAEAYAERLPRGEAHYAFNHRGVRFVVFDANWVWRDGRLMGHSEAGTQLVREDDRERAKWAIADAELAWLDSELSRDKKRPTVVSCHYPAIPIPPRSRRAGIKDAGSLMNGPAVLAVLKKHPQVRAYFAGHLHMNIIEVVDGITHVITSALPEYPCEYREVVVDGDTMTVTSRGLSDPSYAARSLVPGGGWTAGEATDRTAKISLR